MRKLILIACGCMCLAGSAYFLNSVTGQEKAARKEAAAEELPHRIALIDILYVFKNYDKLKFLQEELKAELQVEDENLKKRGKKIQDLAVELKDYKPDTPEYEARLQRGQKLETDLKFDQKQLQIKANREGAKLSLTVYHEVHDVVEKFCRRYNYTLVIQFNRGEANSSDPQQMMQLINQPVVYYRKGENGKCRDDLSEPVVNWLNEKYAKDSGGDDKSVSERPAPKKDKNVKQAGGTEPATGTRRSKTGD